VALALYGLLTFVIVPVWQRYRGRYSRYIPLETIGSTTRSLTQRLGDALAKFLLPSSWQENFNSRRLAASGGSDSGFDEDDGEELYAVDDNRRAALSLDTRPSQDDTGRRLSRDLEEGFRDDSEEEDDDQS
jgi:hypothetical protein